MFISCNKCTSLVQGVGLPGGSVGKESACNEGDLGSIPGSGRSPGGGHGNPLQYSCLENPMDRGAWWAIVHKIAQNRTRLRQFSVHACRHTLQGEERLLQMASLPVREPPSCSSNKPIFALGSREFLFSFSLKVLQRDLG